MRQADLADLHTVGRDVLVRVFVALGKGKEGGREGGREGRERACVSLFISAVSKRVARTYC